MIGAETFVGTCRPSLLGGVLATVLVIDDEEGMRNLHDTLLSRKGYEVNAFVENEFSIHHVVKPAGVSAQPSGQDNTAKPHFIPFYRCGRFFPTVPGVRESETVGTPLRRYLLRMFRRRSASHRFSSESEGHQQEGGLKEVEGGSRPWIVGRNGTRKTLDLGNVSPSDVPSSLRIRSD